MPLGSAVLIHLRERFPVRRILFAVTIATAALGGASYFSPLKPGLRADYFSNASWTPPAAFSHLDRRIATRTLVAAWSGRPPGAFSVRWNGAVLIPRRGTYTFATVSDDDSQLYVDGRLVVDNSGRHAARSATGTLPLDRGTHTLLLLYAQQGGDLHLELQWAREGGTLRRIPLWALWPRNVAGLVRLAPGLLITTAFEILLWSWIALVILTTATSGWRAVRRPLEREGVWRELRWIVAGSLVLNVAGIWWGLPGQWVGIETLPVYVLNGVSQRFSHGWFEAYPPLHYYMLALAGWPVMVLQSQGYLSIESPFGWSLLLIVYRLISIAAGAGTVIATCLCGARVFGKRAGLGAAAIVALMPPFVHYAKTANVDVPYLFWYALSLVFYVRMLETSRVADYARFAASATLAICTKDQAYALYLAVPFVVVYERWRANRLAGRSHPFWRAVVDRRLIVAAVTAAGIFTTVYNFPFNLSGFLSHVRSITDAAAVYRVFDKNFAGQLALFRLTVRLVTVSMGWPLFAAGIAGIVVAMRRARLRRAAAWLLVVIPSYYLGLISIVLYNYDRFMLPICLLLALFGGLAIDAVLTPGAGIRGWRAGALAAVFTYSVLYAATVDVLMIGDSRYTVERWMTANVGANDLVGATGLREYLPRLEGFRTIDITTIDELRRERPRYFVLNADYARAVPPDTPWGQLGLGLQNGTLGYRLAFRFRRPSPWPWLPGGHPDLVGRREETRVFSVLRNINPTIEVFERTPAGQANGGEGPGGANPARGHAEKP
jgi:hypothetical protein